MTDMPDLPRGMRLNNPGNLRASNLPDERTRLVDGFNQFDKIEHGVEALARLTASYYSVLGLRTVPQFVARYAPASENDVALYIRHVYRLTGWNPLTGANIDMRLDRAWNALALMRAIVHVEQGSPGIRWPAWPEWVKPSQWLLGMSAANKWLDL